MQYTSKDGNGNLVYSSLVIKNLRWNGAICVYKSGEFSNIYIGDGSRQGSKLFTPDNLPLLDKEGEEQNEHFEPNPEKEPVVIDPNANMDGDMQDNPDDADNDNMNADDE